MPKKENFNKHALKKTLVAGVLGIVMTNRLLLPLAGAVVDDVPETQNAAPHSISEQIDENHWSNNLNLVMYDAAIVATYGDEDGDDLEPEGEGEEGGGGDVIVTPPPLPPIGGGAPPAGGGAGAAPPAEAEEAEDPDYEVTVDIPEFNIPLAYFEAWENPFVDTAQDAWYAEAVRLVNVLGLMRGMTEDTFSPYTNLTRSMALTVLARSAGIGTIAGDTWYRAAVDWAVEEGISDGMNLAADITREEFVTMLFRHASQMGLDTSARANISDFADYADISGWAREAMSWAVAIGLVQGRGDAQLAPDGTANRAETATLIYRFMTTFDLVNIYEAVDYDATDYTEYENGEDEEEEETPTT